MAANLLFYLFAAVTVGASLLVIAQRSPIYSVLLLIASFMALAGLYVLLDAPFLAVIQIIIYAGAIMVVFLFVVMLLNEPYERPLQPAEEQVLLEEDAASVRSEPAERGPSRWLRGLARGPRKLGIVVALALVVELLWVLWSSLGVQDLQTMAADRQSAETISSVRQIGRVLFTDYAFAFEVTSILILVAMVGAVVLAKREV